MKIMYGLLLGIAGAGLVSLAPWLGGLLLFLGYGRSAYVLRHALSRWDESLYFGFAVAASFGFMMFVGDWLFPEPLSEVLKILGDRHLLLTGFTVLPWILTLARYAERLRHPRSAPTG